MPTSPTSQPRGARLFAAFAALSAVAGSAPAGLYGLAYGEQATAATLVLIAPNGTAVPRGPPLPPELVPSQGLSALDARAGTLFAVLLNATAQAYALVGVSLEDGALTSSLPLPFVVDTFVGLGEYLALNTLVTPTLAYVGGENADGEHEFASVSAVAGGDYRRFATLPASFNSFAGGSSVYVPETHSVLVQLNANFTASPSPPSSPSPSPLSAFALHVFSVSVATGAVRFMNESFDAKGRDIQSLSGYDAVTGHVFGVGVAALPGGDFLREIVELDPVSLTVHVIGNVTVDTVDDGGITAFNPLHRSLYWIGDRGATDEYFLLESSVEAGAALLSRTALCAYDECPATLDFYAGAGAG
jgi:hypothetical protein